MATVLDYLEEEVGYVKASDMPEYLLSSKILSVSRGLLTCDLVDDYVDEYEGDDYQEYVGTYVVLEFRVATDDEPFSFIMVSAENEDEEWIYAESIDDYIEENLTDAYQELSTNYEMISDEDF